MNAAPHLRFVNVAEPGFFAEERIIFRPSSRLNLMEYVIVPMKGGHSPNDAEDLNTDVFWFPDKEVEPGDFVLLYTKSGNDHSFTDSEGNEVHVLYWNKERAVWRDPSTAAAVLKVSDWVFYQIEPRPVEKAVPAASYPAA